MANTNSIPTHLGIILDGNRRWAKRNGLPTLQGHRQGMDNFKDVSLAAFGRGVKFVSAYIFSVENWQRTQEEVSYLMNLVNKGIQKHLETYHQAGIKLVMLGSRQGIEKKILASIDTAIEKTKANTKGTFVLCFNYGGKQEIAEAAQKIAKQGSEITFESLDQAIGLADIPPVDMVIRTSGEQRLSGFMLWRADYSELYFTKTLWPDFSVNNLDEALTEYAVRQRRFGQ